MSDIQVLKNIIESRRSVFPKDYTSEEIPQNIIEEVLNSANFAPNHKRTKPWVFKVFRGEEKNNLGQKIAEIYKETTPPEKFLEKKFHAISEKVEKSDTILTVNVHFSGLVPEWEEIAATAMAVQNMYLVCTTYEIGCYWSTPAIKDFIGDYIGLEESQKCYGFFYMGKV